MLFWSCGRFVGKGVSRAEALAEAGSGEDVNGRKGTGMTIANMQTDPTPNPVRGVPEVRKLSPTPQ